MYLSSDYDGTPPQLDGTGDMKDAVAQVYARHFEVTGMKLRTNDTIESAIRACIRQEGLPMVIAYMDWIDNPAAGLPWYDNRGHRDPNFNGNVTLKSLFLPADRFLVDRAPRIERWISEGRETPIIKTQEQRDEDELKARRQEILERMMARHAEKSDPVDVTPKKRNKLGLQALLADNVR